MRALSPGPAGVWPGRCPLCSADHSLVAGKRWDPQEEGFSLPISHLLDQQPRVLETFSHLRDLEEKRWENWSLLFPSLTISHALWCLFIPNPSTSSFFTLLQPPRHSSEFIFFPLPCFFLSSSSLNSCITTCKFLILFE